MKMWNRKRLENIVIAKNIRDDLTQVPTNIVDLLVGVFVSRYTERLTAMEVHQSVLYFSNLLKCVLQVCNHPSFQTLCDSDLVVELKSMQDAFPVLVTL